jgi:hypothetical protein
MQPFPEYGTRLQFRIKNMDRRQFLKISLTAIGAFFLAKMLNWLPKQDEPKNEMKEASFYRNSDDLAG